ncbi:MAG TPA: addiction module protein [Thermoanaerobaculia bacterium]|jgi:putative addiction module component (TIGR02574 family)
MQKAAEQIANEALSLSAAERAEVAAMFLASLDGEPDEEVEAAWAAEIEHRADRVRAGQAAGRPWSQVRADLERRRA